MSEIDKKEIQDLENEYQEELAKYYREKKHFYYAKIGSLLGIVFIAFLELSLCLSFMALLACVFFLQ